MKRLIMMATALLATAFAEASVVTQEVVMAKSDGTLTSPYAASKQYVQDYSVGAAATTLLSTNDFMLVYRNTSGSLAALAWYLGGNVWYWAGQSATASAAGKISSGSYSLVVDQSTGRPKVKSGTTEIESVAYQGDLTGQSFTNHVAGIINATADASITQAIDAKIAEVLGDENWKATYGTGLAGLVAALVAALTFLKRNKLDLDAVADGWSSSTTYSAGQNVTYKGKFYTSLVDGNLNHEPPNATYWAVSSLFTRDDTSESVTVAGVLKNAELEKSIVKAVSSNFTDADTTSYGGNA